MPAGKPGDLDHAIGFCVTDHAKWSDFTLTEYELKPFEDYDIDVKIEACGVCGSDVHTITGGWGDVSKNFPLCVGHEIVGKALRVGPKVKGIKAGDRVGVGAQIWSCMECKNCKNDNENYCAKMVDTYNAFYPKEHGGTKAQGGYSSHIRAHEQFVFKIPDGLSSEVAAPMLCGGATVYSPLVRYGAGPGKKVAIVGIGGLGHFGVMFAAALGAETYAISHSDRKKEDALRMGAKEFIVTNKPDWEKPYVGEFDLIVSTTNCDESFPLKQYTTLLKPTAHFISVGLPETPLPQLMGFDLIMGVNIGGTHIGNKKEILSMLDLAAKKNLNTWIQPLPLSAENIKKAVEAVKKGDVRYRYVFTDFDKQFPTGTE